MAQENVPLLAFNRGMVSPLALARIDLKRTALSAEIQTNWMPRVLGSQMLRAGLGYLHSTLNNNRAINVPFIFATNDTASLEFTNTFMRVKTNDTPITFASVASSVTSGDFSSDTGWTDNDEAGGNSTITGGFLNLVGTGINSAIRDNRVSIAGGDQNKEHCLKVVVTRGPVTISVGTTSGTDNLMARTSIGEGTHFLTFTPTGANAFIRISSIFNGLRIVDSCQFIAQGVAEELRVPSPYAEANLQSIRWEQSGDVVYLWCKNLPQYKVERRSALPGSPARSWSIVRYLPIDGPFRLINTSTITLTPSGLNGNITLTASKPAFKATNVGSLYRIGSIGQQVTITVNGDNQFSNPIRIAGLSQAGQRRFEITRANLTGDGTTATLQRSVGSPGAWVDLTTYTTDGTTNYNDSQDNQIIYYRIGVKAGQFGSGSADLTLTWDSGTIDGIVRVTAFNSETSVDAEVLSDLGGTTATLDWSEGEWSDRRGYPSSGGLHEGRLWHAGKAKVWGSVSDLFESFDDKVEGDSGPIARSIGVGPVDNINWLLPLSRLILGTQGAEMPIRSTSFDEPITASNFNIKIPSTQGSADVPPVKVDSRGLFVHRCMTKLYQLSLGDSKTGIGEDYVSADLTEIVPEVAEVGIIRTCVQRQPDTRVHCVLADGRVAVLVSQPAEEVTCWLKVETDGMVEDCFVLPGRKEDQVYYVVRRRINGATVRYLEKFAMEADCKGRTRNHQADSYIVYNGAATSTITGLSHLEGEWVVVWADGKDRGVFLVAGGQIVLPSPVREAVVGLGYEAPYLSSKLAYASAGGTALTKKKKVDRLGLILGDAHAQGLIYGPDLIRKDNRFKRSEEMDNAVWTKTAATITANASANPVNGAITADRIVETTDNSAHGLTQVVNLRQTDYNVISAYAKADQRQYLRLRLGGDAGSVQAVFDLTNGYVVSASEDNDNGGTGVRASMEFVGNGWYRCWVSGVCDSAGGFGVTGGAYLSDNGTNETYVGNAANGLTLFGMQIEQYQDRLDEPSDYVPTTTRALWEYKSLQDMPLNEAGQPVPPDKVWREYDQHGVEFPGEWTTDARLAFVARAPRPCTVLAAVVDVKTNA